MSAGGAEVGAGARAGMAGVQDAAGDDALVAARAARGDDLAGRCDDDAAAHHVVAVLAAGLGDPDHPGGILVGAGLHGDVVMEHAQVRRFVGWCKRSRSAEQRGPPVPESERPAHG